MKLLGWTPATLTFRWPLGRRWQAGYVRLDGDALLVRGGLSGFWGPHRLRLRSVRRADLQPVTGSIDLRWRLRRLTIRNIGSDADEIASVLERFGVPVLRKDGTPQ